MEDGYQKGQRRARRHESKRQRLGSARPRCLSCGCLDVEALLPVLVSELPHWFLQKNHLARKAGSNFTIPLCANCHAILTDWQEDWDDRLLHPQTSIERLAALLQGLADWLIQQAQKLTELAARLYEWIRWLLGGMTGEAPA